MNWKQILAIFALTASVATQALARGGAGGGGGGGGAGGVGTPPVGVLPTSAPAAGVVLRESFGPGPDLIFARPQGGNQSQRPSHDTARNRPMTVASVATAGHSRSQKIVPRARNRARLSISLPASGCRGFCSGGRASGSRSFNEISS